MPRYDHSIRSILPEIFKPAPEQRTIKIRYENDHSIKSILPEIFKPAPKNNIIKIRYENDHSIKSILPELFKMVPENNIIKMRYEDMIAEAISNAIDKKLPVKGIYQYLSTNFPDLNTNTNKWQASVRHTLTTSKRFEKEDRPFFEPGKGGYWKLVTTGH